MIYALVGETDEALDSLEQLLRIPAPFSVPIMESESAFRSLRKHPRYRRLVAGHG